MFLGTLLFSVKCLVRYVSFLSLHSSLNKKLVLFKTRNTGAEVEQECVAEILDSQADIDTDSRMLKLPNLDIRMCWATDPDLDVQMRHDPRPCSLPTYKA